MTLTGAVLAAGARRVAFVGLAKNSGKTTALVSVLSDLPARGVVAGVLSAGRDGEAVDALTGAPKPRVPLVAGQLCVSASGAFEAAAFPATLLGTLPFASRFGAMEVRRADAAGELELIGPSTASRVGEACAALEAHGAALVLLDGAFGRRAFASARVADGVVLAVGLAAGRSVPLVVGAAADAVELLRAGPPPAADTLTLVAGALTETWLLERRPPRGAVLLAHDFASVFVPPRRLRELGHALAVRHPARLVAVTSNPTAPHRPPVAAGRLFEALRAALPGDVALFDVLAGLASAG